jgi:plastocyanin
MRKGTKRLLGGLALAAGAVGAAGAYMGRKKKVKAKLQRESDNPASVWARPGMTVTFRAELMPGRDREERTARVKDLLPSGRVTLHEVSGEHAEKEFETN